MKSTTLLIAYLLLLIFLSGCNEQVLFLDSTSEVADDTTLKQLVTPAPPGTSVQTSIILPEITPMAGHEYGTASPQSTEFAKTVNLGVDLVDCRPEPVTQPPPQNKTFQPNEYDSENGLHITGSPQWIDIATFRLKVTGLVDHPLSLTYDELRCMPSVTDNPTLVCPGVFTDYATWTGVSIRDVLNLAGVQSDATHITLVSADGYEVKLPIETAQAEGNFLAYQVNGKPLPIQHGFPLRAIFPEMWGSYWLKWLVEIRIS